MSARQVTEIERKFSVSRAGITPSFDGLDGIGSSEQEPPVTLEATYFDTPDRDLQRHHITLRRRTGGRDEGWHLKLPAGSDRTEVQAPLADEVPAELLSVVRAIVRDRSLEPLATVRTTRSVTRILDESGSQLAEFADDHVVAVDLREQPEQEQSWHEWEIELVGTDDRRLLKRLCRRLEDAGAETSDYPAKLVRAVGEGPEHPTYVDPTVAAIADLVADLIERDRWVRADERDGVHQMRVTTRRLRSLLRSHPALLQLPEAAALEGELKQLAATLGIARDAEVLAKRYERALDALPAEAVRGPVHERLVDDSRAAYRRGRQRAVRAMDSDRYFRLLDGLDQLLTQAGDLGHSASTTASVDEAYRAVRKEGKKARRQPSDAAFHAVRKKAKQLRYVAEAAGRRKVAKAAKQVQTLLGDHQDSVVSRKHLVDVAQKAASAGEDTFTYGVLWQRDLDAAEQIEQELPDLLRRLKKAAD